MNLLQIPPSGYRQAEDISEYLPDFLGQLPISLVLTVCISGALLLVAIVWLAYFKPRRKKRLATRAEATRQNQAVDEAFSLLTAEESDSMEYDPMPEQKPLPKIPQNVTPKKADVEELPDLDLLLDTSGMAKELPNVPPPTKKATPPPPKPSTTTSAPISGTRQTIRLNTGDIAPADSLITIARDARDGRLVVQMNGVGYRTLMDDPKAKEQFVKLMRELSDIVNKPDDNPPATDAPAVIPPPAVETPTIKTAAPPPITPDGKMPGDLPTFKVEDAVVPTRKGKYEAAPLPEINIAASIEAYLQHKLRYNTEFAHYSIHVLSAPGGGVRIQVDNQYYEAVDEIADPTIRAFLQETIAEWQKRQ